MSRCVTVLDPGPMTTVQDLGRPGWAHLGVPRSGALDAASARLANRLVGNPDDAAVLETTLGGVRVQVSAAMAVAVTGAPAEVTVSGRPCAFGEPLALRAGDSLGVGPAQEGVRSYVAFAGGLAVPAELGSRSTDTLSGIGPDRLTAGTTLPVAPAVGPPRPLDVPVVRPTPATVTLRVVPGPRDDWFGEDVWDTLTRASYVVSSDSNRIGVRLHGPALTRVRTEELASEGVVLGAVQVPASGEPLVFLNDHPTTGGYPVVGVVLPDDLVQCAQLRPGTEVRFEVAQPTG